MNHKEDKYYGFTALICASGNGHIDVVNLLLQQKNVNINQLTDDGNAALHYASFHGHTETVKLLLVHSDIDVNIKDNAGDTPLKIASRDGHTQIMELLKAKEKGKEEEEEKKHNEAPHKMISEVKEKYKGKYLPPFIQAAFDGNVEDVRILLLEDDMDVNQKDKYGTTALHLASYYGDIDVVNLLLQQKNLKINQRSKYGHGMDILKLSNYF